jgi:tetratricopeptide (TPR) repeat protein
VAEASPNCAAYWNTLGVAHYRAGDFNATISALGWAIDLTQGGTAFDHVFLAMAHAQLGDQEQALHWLDRARLWMQQYNPDHSELGCLCDEARSVLSAVANSSIAAH